MLKNNYHFHSLRVAVESDEENIVGDFNKIFRRFQIFGSEEADIAYNISVIDRKKSEKKIYCLSRNREIIFETRDRFEIVPLLEWDFYRYFISALKGFYF